MSRKGSIGSIFWGLALIAGGGVFLAKNLGYDVPIWSGIARYWPTLLIVWGLIKMYDYYRWQRSGQQGSLFSGGEVVLLVLVILTGSAMTAAVNVNPDFGGFLELADIDLWDIAGNSYEYTEHLEQDARSGSTINIINRYGAVEVTPADTDRIILDVTKTVIAANQEEADRLSKTMTYSIMAENGGYQIWSTLNRDTNRVRGRRFKTSLTIKVPKGSSLIVDNRNGEVSVSDLNGNQKITNLYGPVTVRRIAGDVTLSNTNESVTVEDINGAAEIANEFSTVSVNNVSGRLEVRHRHGRVEVNRVAGAKITNAFGPVIVSDVSGSLEINGRNSAVEVSRTTDSVTVRTEFDHVRILDAKGALDIRNQHGAVSVAFSQPPTKDVRITSQYGEVTFETPATSSFTIDARTRYGSVSSDFEQLTERSDDQRNSVAGQVGTAGPEIRIENRHASIRIEKR